MQKSKLYVALGICFAGSGAFAQTTIQAGAVELTPYVRIVAGVDYTSNLLAHGEQGNRIQVAANQWAPSLFGIKAGLPLSDGWKAVAHLEGGFAATNGQSNGSLLNRFSNVGISNEKFGTFTAGNHLWISNDTIDIDPMSYQAIGVNSLVGGRNWGIGPNTFQYRSPVISGLQFSYMHMAGGAVGHSESGSGDGISFSYTDGSLKLLVVADNLKDANGHYSANTSHGLSSQGDWTFSKELIVGGSYQIGAAKIFAGYNKITAPDVNLSTNTRYDDKAEHTWIGLNYQLTEKLSWLAASYNLKQEVSGKKSHLMTTGLNYAWNKNFTMYATVGTINNNAINTSAVSMNGPNNHALYYWNAACKDLKNCNGADSLGAYTGFAISF